MKIIFLIAAAAAATLTACGAAGSKEPTVPRPAENIKMTGMRASGERKNGVYTPAVFTYEFIEPRTGCVVVIASGEQANSGTSSFQLLAANGKPVCPGTAK